LKRGASHFGSQNGHAVILVVVAMSIFVIGALGLAIDGGQMYAQRQMAQAAADAAAQAGIMSIYRGTNATSSSPFGIGASPAAFVCAVADTRTPCVYARYNGFGGTSSDTVTLSFPLAVSGVTLSSVSVPALAVTVNRILKTGLIRFVGAPATSSITAIATAGLVGTVSPDSIIVLDPSGQNAFQANNGASVVLNGGAIAINSTSSDAATISGGARITAAAIDCACPVGGVQLNNGGSTSPTPVTGVAVTADPFASLPVPPLGNCSAHPTMTSPAAGATLTPGTYCGGITVTSNDYTNVTFSAGIYIINGGGVTFNGGIASGSGVMFYLTGTNATYSSLTINNGATLTLSAPTSGTYLGVLFFQDRSITSSNNAALTDGTMQLTGSLYFPTTDVAFSNGVNAQTNSTAIIAQQVSFAGGANIKYDPTGLQTGLFSKSVALVK
jgi:hypothetical protein